MTKKVQSEGIEIAFEVAGQGTPLVLLHGFSDARAFWHDQGYVDAFLKAGRQVILIDARGHGESGKPKDAEAYALPRRAADVIAVLDALRIESAEVLGYSMGGWTVLGLVCHFPERLRSVVAGGAHPYLESLRSVRDAIAAGIEVWIGVLEGMAGRMTAQMREGLLANDLEALAAVVARDRPDISAAVASSRVPLLLYAGETDPRHALCRRFAEESGAAFVSLPGMNHLQALLAKDVAVREALAFFDKFAHRAAA